MIVYMTIGVVLIFLAFFLGLAVSGTGKDSKKDIIREITKTWRSVDKVGELIELYLIMAIKHGPDSQEATSFRYGVENKDLYGDKDSLAAFNVVVNRFECAWEKQTH